MLRSRTLFYRIYTLRPEVGGVRFSSVTRVGPRLTPAHGYPEPTSPSATSHLIYLATSNPTDGDAPPLLDERYVAEAAVLAADTRFNPTLAQSAFGALAATVFSGAKAQVSSRSCHISVIS
jgi:hypothetical protein